MASDDASEEARTQRPGRGSQFDPWQIGLGVLLVLAVVATVVMLFTDSQLWLRIGTLAALWAAFIGAFLVSRYRRQAALEAARARDLQTVYELQLEREVNARYEHEIELEKKHREQIETQTDDSVFALRQEIYALREQLSSLTGQPVTDPPPTLAATPTARLGAAPERTSVPSERVERRGVDPQSTPSESRTARLSPIGSHARGAGGRGPGAGPSGSGPTASGASGYGHESRSGSRRSGVGRPPVRPAAGPPVRPSTPKSRESGGTGGLSGAQPESAKPSGPAQPESSQQGVTPPVAPRREPESQPRPAARPRPEPGAPSEPLSWPLSDDEWSMEFPGDQFTSGGNHSAPSPSPATPSEPDTSDVGEAEPASAAEIPESEESAEPEESALQRGEHAEGTSFADIMARIQSESGSVGGTGGGRRRRAADD